MAHQATAVGNWLAAHLLWVPLRLGLWSLPNRFGCAFFSSCLFLSVPSYLSQERLPGLPFQNQLSATGQRPPIWQSKFARDGHHTVRCQWSQEGNGRWDLVSSLGHLCGCTLLPFYNKPPLCMLSPHCWESPPCTSRF